ncbi:hypothetical protein NEOKW01_1097 [Nematocida sp. AWRm80]|nr:hypothetical protein NEOKW01_1097 [Nematocida sp. AWRm80]
MKLQNPILFLCAVLGLVACTKQSNTFRCICTEEAPETVFTTSQHTPIDLISLPDINQNKYQAYFVLAFANYLVDTITAQDLISKSNEALKALYGTVKLNAISEIESAFQDLHQTYDELVPLRESLFPYRDSNQAKYANNRIYKIIDDLVKYYVDLNLATWYQTLEYLYIANYLLVTIEQPIINSSSVSQIEFSTINKKTDDDYAACYTNSLEVKKSFLRSLNVMADIIYKHNTTLIVHNIILENGQETVQLLQNYSKEIIPIDTLMTYCFIEICNYIMFLKCPNIMYNLKDRSITFSNAHNSLVCYYHILMRFPISVSVASVIILGNDGSKEHILSSQKTNPHSSQLQPNDSCNLNETVDNLNNMTLDESSISIKCNSKQKYLDFVLKTTPMISLSLSSIRSIESEPQTNQLALTENKDSMTSPENKKYIRLAECSFNKSNDNLVKYLHDNYVFVNTWKILIDNCSFSDLSILECFLHENIYQYGHIILKTTLPKNLDTTHLFKNLTNGAPFINKLEIDNIPIGFTNMLSIRHIMSSVTVNTLIIKDLVIPDEYISTLAKIKNIIFKSTNSISNDPKTPNEPVDGSKDSALSVNNKTLIDKTQAPRVINLTIKLKMSYSEFAIHNAVVYACQTMLYLFDNIDTVVCNINFIYPLSESLSIPLTYYDCVPKTSTPITEDYNEDGIKHLYVYIHEIPYKHEYKPLE